MAKNTRKKMIKYKNKNKNKNKNKYKPHKSRKILFIGGLRDTADPAALDPAIAIVPTDPTVDGAKRDTAAQAAQIDSDSDSSAAAAAAHFAALNARMRYTIPPTIPPAILFEKIAEFQKKLLQSEDFAKLVWVTRIVKDEIVGPGSSKSQLNDLYCMEITIDGEPAYVDTTDGKKYHFPASLLVRCGLDRKIRGIYIISSGSSFADNDSGIPITKNVTYVFNPYDIHTIRMLNIYKLEDFETWNSRNEKNKKEQQKHKRGIDQSSQSQTDLPVSVKVIVKRTLVQFIIYNDGKYFGRQLSPSLLALFQREKQPVDREDSIHTYYSTRFLLQVDPNNSKFAYRAVNTSFGNHRKLSTSTSLVRDFSEIVRDAYNREQLKRPKIPNAPVWGDLGQYNTLVGGRMSPLLPPL